MDAPTLFTLQNTRALVAIGNPLARTHVSEVLRSAGADVAEIVDGRLRDYESKMVVGTSRRFDIATATGRSILLDGLHSSGRVPQVLVTGSILHRVAAGTSGSREPLDSNDSGSNIELDLASKLAPEMAATGGGSIIHVAMTEPPITGMSPDEHIMLPVADMLRTYRRLAAAWARRHVRCNLIVAGASIAEDVPLLTKDATVVHQGSAYEIPMGRPGQLRDLDGALLLLGSRASTYITGQLIAVDGGRMGTQDLLER